MIPKHIKPQPLKGGEKPPHYNYATLAHYIADTKHEGEKLQSYWIVNCESGEGREALPVAIHEIKSTQKQNTRAKGDKTYHLMVSFRKEDTLPSREALRDIERHFAEALGFEEHQRMIGVHKDTQNVHMHIGYNKVHPVKFNCHSPSHDYRELEKVSREMEKKYGLAVDLGRSDKEEPSRVPTGAADMEAHRWEESFDGYVRRHKDELMKSVKEAKSWPEVHQGFAEYDLAIKLHGNGLVIVSKANKKHRVKASSIDRSFSKPNLEKRFGTFQVPKQDAKEKKPKDTYKPRPTTKHRGQSKLWKRYRANRKAWHKGWKSFLYQMAVVQDPLAMAIIYAQKKMIEGLLSPKASLPIPYRGRAFEKEQRFYVGSAMQYPKAEGGVLDNTIPRSKRDEGKKLGARWDRDKKSWYATSKEAILSLELLSVKAKLAQERNKAEKLAQKEAAKVYLDVPYEEKDKAKNAGARWDNDKKSWYATSYKSARKVIARTSAKKTEEQKQKELYDFVSTIAGQSLLSSSLSINGALSTGKTVQKETIAKQLRGLSNQKQNKSDKNLEI